jgi:hypothetical protein
MEVLTRNGEFFISTKLQRLRLRDLTKNSVSILTDHSTWYLSFHSIELLRCLVEPTWYLRDGERILDSNNSSSMRFQKPSETTTGRTTASISRATVTPIT